MTPKEYELCKMRICEGLKTATQEVLEKDINGWIIIATVQDGATHGTVEGTAVLCTDSCLEGLVHSVSAMKALVVAYEEKIREQCIEYAEHHGVDPNEVTEKTFARIEEQFQSACQQREAHDHNG